MALMIREPECVRLKRRGAEHVENLIAGLSLPEQLVFWERRTEIMLERKREHGQGPDARMPGCQEKSNNKKNDKITGNTARRSRNRNDFTP
uniref:Uncharacterized protein n=1 Tax=Candidatus Kentrum sp. DK TaxID=2126562 RepID=A0A450T203_9GAMM|nr:MAG: hypothetical protein BECKDK2373C_GA0170839_10805 [Candidatus Kentron sp. DK]